MKRTSSQYNIEWLTDLINNGINIKYVYFWKPTITDVVTRSCFSQWFKSGFVKDGVAYNTAEHWMMSQKAKLFGDNEILEKILETNDPGQVQILGRKIKNFDPKIWYENSFNIVFEGNYHKFSQCHDLKEFLLNTKDSILVEASPLDRIWGIGLAEEDERSANPYLWKGLNLLGFALMEVRDRLKNEER